MLALRCVRVIGPLGSAGGSLRTFAAEGLLWTS